ncbi:MAG: hypothetical protein KatS3mg084_0533 [Candidatus Dojkabacteria bacterium]|nr:MAG: hypothetical protein KatS3mg084_0533 [Candidatus Dojkabacteria bacterium]
MLKAFNNLLASKVLQPILTIVLVITIAWALFQFTNTPENQREQVRILEREVTFDEAVNNLLNNTYEVYTSGSLFVKANITSSIGPDTQGNLNSPNPSVVDIPVIENKYDDILFTVQRNKVIRIDTKNQGSDETLLINRKGEIIYMNNLLKKYMVYEIPADSDKDAVSLFVALNSLFREQIFPFTPLLNDYKDKKFHPVRRAYNVYSGKWRHKVYTSDELKEVIIETDPITGVFKSIAIASSNPPSVIYFDFRKLDDVDHYDKIEDDFEQVPVPKPYKTKD